MSNIRLSICIATLNRVRFIGATLDSIISQATDQVEIVVVDGASTDGTTQLVQQYQVKFPRLRYIRLDARGGVDRDYDRAVGMAQGEYCWLFSDDDLLKPGAIEAVLDATRKDYSLVIVNAETRNSDLSELLSERQLFFHEDRTYLPTLSDREKLLSEVGFYLTFIGGVVVRRTLWNTRDREPYYGTEFIHMGVIFDAPLTSPVLVLSQPWIVIRYGNAQWTERYFEIWMFKLPRLIWGLPNVSDAARRSVSPREPWRRPGALFLYRARGVYGQNEYIKWLAPRLSARWDKFIAGAIAELPGHWINQLARMYAHIRRHRLLLVDLEQSPFRRSNGRGNAT